jgi:hypothetical protein
MDAVVRALVEQHGASVRLDVAASIAGFSVDKVRELCRAGRFPGHRAGTKVMVFVPELVEWMRNGGEAQYEPSPAPPRSLHARRKADRPPWMDRVWPRAAADEPLNGQT